MSSAEHPHLEEQARRRRQRSVRNLGVAGGMALGFTVVLVYVLLNAGRWGVPMFGYTNEFGSRCKNNFLGRTCDPMTLADIRDKVGVEIPDDARVLLGVWKQTHDYELDARLLYPQDSADRGADALRAAFGDCRFNIPNPLNQVQGLTDICTMTNVGTVKLDGGKRDPRIWQVSLGRQPDGNTVVHIHLRSR